MCKYCNVEKNGDINYEPIITFDPDGLRSVVGVNANHKTLCATVCYDFHELTNNEGTIYYCPMCGRKL